MNNGDPIKDNMVVLLISKTIIIQDVKTLFKQDLQNVNSNHYGHLIPLVLSFVNNDSNYPIIAQNISLYFFLMRINTNTENPEIIAHIKRLLDNFNFQFTLFQQYRNWWESEKVKQKPEFFTTIQDITYFSIICNVIPTEGEMELIRFQSNGSDPSIQFPGVGGIGTVVT
ncbi:hypothetical protein ACTFIU_009268, partial [Dictyostelium citrinum]